MVSSGTGLILLAWPAGPESFEAGLATTRAAGWHAQGIESVCLSLDPEADCCVRRILGGQHVVVDHVQRLPERLPGLFASLTS